jgi:hypothetical protein
VSSYFVAGAKLPEETVVRIIKCLGHSCSIEATADICEVDQRTVERPLEKAGPCVEDFHRSQLKKLQQMPFDIYHFSSNTNTHIYIYDFGRRFQKHQVALRCDFRKPL